MDKDKLLKAASFTPYVFRQNSAWLGHLPFAAFLMQHVAPKIFVELGAHWGHSYFSFCQSVKEAGLSSKCYAVDIWQGDAHAGHYGDDVFQQVDTHNQACYAGFSRLLRMTFDEALNYFEDGTVELLHIDGFHTYDAVKHDFETWLPKLAQNAIVLFHDTNVRERGFGVWKFWEELQSRYPNNIEFFHSHGLGVLQVNNVSSDKALWLESGTVEQKAFREYFAVLGERQLERFELKQQRGQVQTLNQLVSERDGQVQTLNQLFSERDGQVQTLNQLVSEQNKLIADLLNSESWRISAPLRWIGHQVRRVGSGVKATKIAINDRGGLWRAFHKIFKIFMLEGVDGVKKRIHFLLTINNHANSLSPHASVALKTEPHSLEFSSEESKRSCEVSVHDKQVDIIVCVHNALEDVTRCLESILCHTVPPYRLILVDDGSEIETQEYLQSFSASQSALLIRHDSALGYTKAANRGMYAATGDYVVLLNSDTIVPSRWLDRLVECADSDESIGVVGPLSNTASWQSVPYIFNASGDWADNPLPDGWTVDQYANEVARVAPRVYPRVGFLNGFCLLIKRSLIQDIGYFDEVTFARGYGEESDYCLRATQQGWGLAIAEDCYVFHAQSKSYSHTRRAELSRLAGEALANKYGQSAINLNLELTRSHPVLSYMQQRCTQIELTASIREEMLIRFEGKKVLFVLPAGTTGGGGNIVLLEAKTMREAGVNVWIANLEANRHLFESSHPDLSTPVLYLKSPNDIKSFAADFDAIIATLYLTVFWLAPLAKQNNCPVLGYYIQDFEPDFFAKNTSEYAQAFASYTAIPNMSLFTKTNWNSQMLKKELNLNPNVIGSSLDVDSFYPTSIFNTKKLKIRISAMIQPSTPRRAPEMTMQVLRLLSERFKDKLEIVIFGVEPNNRVYEAYPKEFPHQCLGELDVFGVRNVLAVTDIFVDCSIFQAMGLTAMEAMAVGAVVVGPINGGLSEIITDGHNGLLVDTQSCDAIVEAVSSLVVDEKRLKDIRSHVSDVLSHSPLLSAYKILDCLFPIEKPQAVNVGEVI